MGIWSKGLERAQTGEERIEDINIDLIFESWGSKYININLLLEPYKKKHSILDLTKSQVISWSIYKWNRLSLKPEKRGNAFIITDGESKKYMYYNNNKGILTAGDYTENLLTNKENVKSTFVQSLKRLKYTTPIVYDLTSNEIKQIKKTMKYVNKQINEYRVYNKQRMDKWLNT